MKSKRILSAAMAAVLCVGVSATPAFDRGDRAFTAITANAFAPEDDFYYSSEDDKVTITKYGGEGGIVDIPSTIAGMSVTGIGPLAFSDCTNLTGVTIPKGVTSIGAEAFSGCTNLTSVTIPDGVESIGGGAFQFCEKIKTISLPGSVSDIGYRAFRGCKSLTSAEIPNGVTSVGSWIFDDCSNLTSVTIPDSVTAIGNGAFRGCTSLTGIVIPENVTDIGTQAFESCTSITDIVIPERVAFIGGGAFYGCAKLKSVTIPNSVTGIGEGAFFECPVLKDVYYIGTKAQWKKIEIDSRNDCLLNATIHYSDDDSETTSLSQATVTVSNKTYTGKALKPAVTVKLSGKTLKSGTDYSVAYKNNTNCGKATVTVTGKGSYTGTKSGSFIIKPKKVTAKKLTSPKTKQIKLTWTKASGGVTGYEVQIATNSKFNKGKKSYTVAKASAASKTITKLKKGTKYFARVRAYKTVGKTKYYGAWSAVKNVKCK